MENHPAWRAQDKAIEIAIIEVLASLQNKLHFEKLISTTDDYNQTLAYFAVHLGYPNSLGRPMEWNIGPTIADVNGIAVLQCAYKKGDRACVELLLKNGAPKTVLDALGQAPSHLMPDTSDPSYDCNTDIGAATVDQSRLEESLSGMSPSKSTDLKQEVSGDETSVGNPNEHIGNGWIKMTPIIRSRRRPKSQPAVL